MYGLPQAFATKEKLDTSRSKGEMSFGNGLSLLPFPGLCCSWHRRCALARRELRCRVCPMISDSSRKIVPINKSILTFDNFTRKFGALKLQSLGGYHLKIVVYNCFLFNVEYDCLINSLYEFSSHLDQWNWFLVFLWWFRKKSSQNHLTFGWKFSIKGTTESMITNSSNHRFSGAPRAVEDT